MSEDISEKVRALLEDPEMLAKIVAIASGLGGSKPAASPTTPTAPAEYEPPYNPAREVKPALQVSAPQPTAEPLAKITDILKPTTAPHDPRLSLLNSLKPFLREDRRSKLDNLTKALSVATLMGSFGKDKKGK